jgi:hypothetical protein
MLKFLGTFHLNRSQENSNRFPNGRPKLSTPIQTPPIRIRSSTQNRFQTRSDPPPHKKFARRQSAIWLIPRQFNAFEMRVLLPAKKPKLGLRGGALVRPLASLSFSSGLQSPPLLVTTYILMLARDEMRLSDGTFLLYNPCFILPQEIAEHTKLLGFDSKRSELRRITKFYPLSASQPHRLSSRFVQFAGLSLVLAISELREVLLGFWNRYI